MKARVALYEELDGRLITRREGSPIASPASISGAFQRTGSTVPSNSAAREEGSLNRAFQMVCTFPVRVRAKVYCGFRR